MDTANNPYRIVKRYWEQRPPGIGEEEFGVPPIGGCGPSEVLYREFEEIRHLRKVVTFGRDMAVAELGCGNGRWVLALAPLVRSYTALDVSEPMIAIARRRVLQARLGNVAFYVASVMDFIPTEEFDVVYLAGVSQYLHDEDLKRLMERLRKCLKPGGVLIDRSTLHWIQRCEVSRDDYFSIYRTAEEFIGLYREAGWENYYRAPSYQILDVPEFMRRVLRRSICIRLVRAAAPFSFHVLRVLACGSRKLFRPRGDYAVFTHDFLLFRAK